MYGISGSHSVTCHPTQVNTPHLNPGDLLHTEVVYPPTARRPPIHV